MKKIFIIHSDCELIINSLKNDLLNEGYFYEEIVLNNTYRDSLKLLKNSSRLYRNNLVICSPISPRILATLFLCFLIKPLRLIYIVPPSSKHSSQKLLFQINKYMFKIVLSLIKLNRVKQLLVFTTPYEKMILENIIRGTNSVYYSTYFMERPRTYELLLSEKMILSFFIYESDELNLVENVIRVFEEIGLKPLIIVNVLNRNILSCISDYRAVCIHNYEFDETIKNSALVIVKTPSPESNNVVLKSIFWSKPVITTQEHGLAIVYSNTGFIHIQKLWTPDSLAFSILNILGNLDNLKKKALSINIDTLSSSFGKHIITKFLTNEM